MEGEDGGIVGASMKERLGGDDRSAGWKLRVGSGNGACWCGIEDWEGEGCSYRRENVE
jgi:hypothetical protein